MKKYLLPLILLCGSLAWGQASRQDGQVFAPSGTPVHFPTIRVCTASATAGTIGTTNFCGTLATLFQDHLATACSTSCNPFTGDYAGNYHFYGAAGRVILDVVVNGVLQSEIPDDIIACEQGVTCGGSATLVGGVNTFLTIWTGPNTVAASNIAESGGVLSTTDAVNFGSAGNFTLPTAAGFAPTVAGVFGYDSTSQHLVYGNGTTTIKALNSSDLGATIVQTNANATFGAFTYDFTGVSSLRLRTGTTAAVTATSCITGDVAIASDATAGQMIYECKSNVWTQQLNSGGGGAGCSGCTNTFIPVFNGTNLVNSKWTDNGTSALYAGSNIGVGSGDASCGSAVACFGGSEGTTEGTPTAGHSYIRPDSTLYSHSWVASNNGDGPFLMVRSTNSGSLGQALLSNANGTATFADPNISVNTVSLFSAQSATGTATSAAISNPLRSGYGTLTISGTGITGSPQGCQITLFYSQAGSGVTDANPFATVFFTPASSKQNFAVAPSSVLGAQGDNIVATYNCTTTFPGAGSITVSFNPAMPVAPSGSSLPMNIAQIGGQALSANIQIAHDPSQASTCGVNSNAATNTITITGLVINANDTVMVGIVQSGVSGTVTVTDSGGSTYSTLISKSAASLSRAYIVASTASAAVASTSVTVTLSGNAKFVACISTYTGVQSFGSSASNSSTSNNPSVVVTTQDPGNFVFAVLGEGTVNALTANTGTLLAQGQTTSTTPASGGICDNTAAVPTAIQCSVNATSSAWASAGVEMRSEAATSATLPITIAPGQGALTTPLNIQPFGQDTAGFGGQISCDKTAIQNAFSTVNSTQIVAASGSKNIYVCGWEVNSASTSAVTVKLQVGTGTNCGTGTQDMSAAVALQALSGNAPVGKVLMAPANAIWSNNSIATPVASPELCVNLSAAQSVNLQVWYAQF